MLCHNEKGQQQTYQYVPLLEQLEVLLRNQTLSAAISADPEASFGLYEDWSTGNKHAAKNGLYIHLYYDEFQTVNPLGTKTKRNKLGAIYFTVGFSIP